MRVGHLRGIVASFVVGLVALVVVSGIPGLSEAYTPQGTGTRQGELTLVVGGQDEMKTRNLLPSIANDVWTSDVHYRVYDSVLQGNPSVNRPMAYIAKGVDVNQDGIFERSEYDQWRKDTGTDRRNVTVYYDFNGVYWQDGVQMDIWDLLFSYHVSALNPRFNTNLRLLYCDPTGTYDGCNRQLNIEIAPWPKNWEGESNIPGDASKRFAVHFWMTEDFALFYDSTLAPVMLPMHEWSRFGPAPGGGLHHSGVDFGCAVWLPPSEATARGIPECTPSPPDPAKWGHGIAKTESVPGSTYYQYSAAEQWQLQDADMIGNGPFKFDTWVSGVEATVIRYDRFFHGVDPDNPSIVYDAQLARVLKMPNIDGIRFKVYKTTQLGVFALQNGEVDFYHWNVGAEFVPDLLKIPEIAVEANAEPGFFYMAYNFRREPWGYKNGDPNQEDIGYNLRQAFSHVIDKKSIVQNLLQNFGVVGHGVVSPANTFWYNDNIPKPNFDLTQAASILDDMAQPGGNIPQIPGYSLDPPGTCSRDTPSGCRSLPGIGNAAFEILTPQADYDPVRASAGAMVADAMRQVGINAVSKPTAFGEITQRTASHDFDVFILGWRIGGTDPDYLFDFFDSSNAPSGQNYGGYQNATFDTTIRASRAELDRTTRQTLIFEAQRILAVSRPYDVLYYRTNIEGYRQDRFVNWTVSSGTIWNWWSLQGIHPPSTRTIRLSLSTDSAVVSGGTSTVTATVFDNNNQALSGANVSLSVENRPDQGNLSIGGGTPARLVYALTDANGQLRITYHAATISSETQVLLDGMATHPNFPDPSARQVVVRIFPVGVPFLSVRTLLRLGDRVTSGGALPMAITVSDQGGSTVPDATVTVIVDPPGAGLTPDKSTGTATDMGTVTLSSAPSVLTTTDFTVTVQANKTGFAEGSQTFTVTVVPPGDGNTYTCPDGRIVTNPADCQTGPSTPALDVVWVLAGIGAVAVVAGVLAERKRRS